MNQTNSPAFYQQQGQQTQPQSLQQQQPPQAQPQILPVQAQNPNYQAEVLDLQNDGLVDPIIKSKEMYVQLGNSLKALLNQLTIILNPPNESRIQTENQFQQVGKIVENFNRVCDLFVANLRAAHEAQSISIEFKSLYRYYANIGQQDFNRNEIPLVNSINIQMHRINDFKNLMQRFLALNTSLNINTNSQIVGINGSGQPNL